MGQTNVEVGGRLLTAREAAGLLRASRAKLYRLLKAGELAGYKVGSTWVFYEHDLHSYVRRQRGVAGQPNGIDMPVRGYLLDGPRPQEAPARGGIKLADAGEEAPASGGG